MLEVPQQAQRCGWVDAGTLDYIRSDGSHSGSEDWALSYFRYMTIPPGGPSWKMTDFDFDRDYRRINGGTREPLLTPAILISVNLRWRVGTLSSIRDGTTSRICRR